MKKLRILLIALLIAPAISAAPHGEGKKRGPSEKDRQEWMQKMQEYKHGYLTRELDLSERQSEEFFKLYDEMERERFAAERKVRKLEREVQRKGDDATEKELNECIDAQIALPQTYADIQKKYIAAIRKVLSKRQLCKLPRAERGFQQQLMERRRDCPPPPKD